MKHSALLVACLLFTTPMFMSAQNQQLSVPVRADAYSIAEVRDNNTIYYSSLDLELHGKDLLVNQETFIRFENIVLPEDAVITDAYIRFVGKTISLLPTSIAIKGEIGNSISYPVSTAASSGVQIKGRPYTTTTVTWATSTCLLNKEYPSPGLKPLISQMFPSGIPRGANLAFRFTGNKKGDFTVYSYHTAAYLPTLVIKYTSNFGSSEAIVNASKNDGRESNTGAVTLDAAYLQLGGRSDGNKHAIRFEKVRIPQAARLTDAYIEFYAYEKGAASEIDIYGESGNPAIYTTASKNISSRKYSNLSKVHWSAAALTANYEKIRTPNLKTIIEEKRLLGGWKDGENLAFLFNGLSGNNGLSVRSYEGGETYRPRLVIEYQNTGGPSFDIISDPVKMTKLYINELSSQGTREEEENWIELYNDHNEPLFINGGIYLSNKATGKGLNEIKNVIIPPKGFAVLLADEKPEKGNLHLDFSLKKGGASVYLYRNDAGNNLVIQDEVTYGAIPFDHTWGRITDGTGDFVEFIEGTCNATNVLGVRLQDITFSRERGVYPSGFSLTISASAGMAIRYTLDGTYPSPTSGTIYSGPLTINKTCVVKAVAYNTLVRSEIVSHSYVLLDNYKNEAVNVGIGRYLYAEWLYKNNVNASEYAQAMAQLPVVSLSLNSDVEEDWKEASAEYIDNHIYADRPNFFSNSLAKRFGNWSLLLQYNSSVKFKFVKDAGVKKPSYPFFDPYPSDRFPLPEKTQCLDLKEGQDGPAMNFFELGFMRFSEKVTMNLMKEMGKFAMETRYVNLFVNGKYRGVKTMRNDFKQQNVEEVFGDNSDNYTFVSLDDDHYNTAGKAADIEGNAAVWNKIVAAANAKDLQTFKEMVDVEDLIKYQIMNMFIDGENEVKLIFHNEAPQYMKAKFIINDTDGAFWGAAFPSNLQTEIMLPVNFLSNPIINTVFNYKSRWSSSRSLDGPAGMFAKFGGSKSSATAGNLEFKTLVKDYVLESFGPLSGPDAGNGKYPLSVANVQKKIRETVEELDLVYKLDAAYMGAFPNVYSIWKNSQYPRVMSNVPERVSYSMARWKEYNMAHTLSAATVTEESVPENTKITIVNPNSGTQVYYTLDGSDPMGNNGTVSPQAALYNPSTGIVLAAGSYKITTRAFTTNNWGPKAGKHVTVTGSLSEGRLVISGINYNMGDEPAFLLLTNAGGTALDLSGYSIMDAIEYTFPAGATLAPGKIVMLVKDPALTPAYGDYTMYKWAKGNLAKKGEEITVKNASDEVVDFVSYSNKDPWPVLAEGYFLKLKDLDSDNSLPENWEAVSIDEPIVPLRSSLRSSTETESAAEILQIEPEMGISVSLNPVSSILNVEGIDNDANLYIYSLSGKLMMERTIRNTRESWDVSSLPAGVYILRILDKKENKTVRLIKR